MMVVMLQGLSKNISDFDENLNPTSIPNTKVCARRSQIFPGVVWITHVVDFVAGVETKFFVLEIFLLTKRAKIQIAIATLVSNNLKIGETCSRHTLPPLRLGY